MAVTSGTFNLVELTKVEYADVDLSSATLPTVLKTLLPSEIKEGTFNIDFPEPSVTVDYTEDGESHNARRSPVTRKASLGLVKALMSTVADFMEGTFTAGTAGTTPDSLSCDGTERIANKYVKITGINTEGENVTVELFNARVATSWSGNMGKNQEAVALNVSFYILKNSGYGKIFKISPAF